MLEKKIANLLRRLLPVDRYIFRKINSSLGLGLDYGINKDAVSILESIMVKREYADYFPFYKKAVIVDIGAHYGYFSLFAALNTAEDSRIIALEPSPTNFSILNRNLTVAGLKNIQAIQAAIAKQSGPVTLFRSHSFNHSLYPSDQDGTRDTVPGITLSQLFEQQQLSTIDFLKIDCEGAEYPILLEASPSLLSRIQTISLEFHDLRQKGYAPDDLAEHLRKNGFEIVKFVYDADYSIGNLNFGKMVAVRVK